MTTRIKFLIVNGDDFGASRGTNRGILEAHLKGILTSTSLLVDAPCSTDATDLCRIAPRISIGLHAHLDGPARVADGSVREALEAVLPDDLGRWVDCARTTRRQWLADKVPMADRRPLLLDALVRIYGR